MTVFLALLAILVPASLTLVGYWFKQQQDRRLDSERAVEQSRLKLDAAMRAAELFVPDDEKSQSDDSLATVRAATGLLSLAQLDRADLAVALLVDLWAPYKSDGEHRLVESSRSASANAGHHEVSDETAVLVINAALQSTPNAQLVAAELLCRNSDSLDICQSLHWPRSIDGQWIPDLPPAAKLLILDALVRMACASKHTTNALRILAVRLYCISALDPSPRVKGCVGTLIEAILPAVRSLRYEEFMHGMGTVKMEQMEAAAAKASPNPDGYLETILLDRSQKLAAWSSQCTAVGLGGGALASAADLVWA